jgi:hypothetical protein
MYEEEVSFVSVRYPPFSYISEYNTKGKQDLDIQLCNTASCKKSVINMGIKIHNNLPLD